MTAALARRLALPVAAVAALTLVGCSNAVEGLAEQGVERAIENELGDDADVKIDEDSVTIDTEEGSLTAGAGSVPEDFPADIPLAGGEVTFAQSLEGADGRGWTVVVTTTAEPTALADQIRTDLQSNGFTVDDASEFAAGDASGGTILAEKEGLSAFILVAAETDQTVVTYTVNEVAPAS